jgi:hypothetical protein
VAKAKRVGMVVTDQNYLLEEIKSRYDSVYKHLSSGLISNNPVLKYKENVLYACETWFLTLS